MAINGSSDGISTAFAARTSRIEWRAIATALVFALGSLAQAVIAKPLTPSR